MHCQCLSGLVPVLPPDGLGDLNYKQVFLEAFRPVFDGQVQYAAFKAGEILAFKAHLGIGAVLECVQPGTCFTSLSFGPRASQGISFIRRFSLFAHALTTHTDGVDLPQDLFTNAIKNFALAGTTVYIQLQVASLSKLRAELYK